MIQNDLTFNYTALNFTQAEQNQFKIKLLGLEDDWRNVGFKREIEYQNLRPGSYRFEVKGSNYGWVWSDQQQGFSFSIVQPWYNRWWAWLAYGAILFSIVFILIKITLARLNLEAELKIEQLEIEKLIELDKVKSRFVANVSFMNY